MTENEAINMFKNVSIDYKNLRNALECKVMIDMAIKALEEVQEYRKLGTVEECREAVEKTKAKKVVYQNRHGEGDDDKNVDYFICPVCGRRLRNKQKDSHCGRCGQKVIYEI